jgi:DNA invertase Pin-like site-specific DNA recombinase
LATGAQGHDGPHEVPPVIAYTRVADHKNERSIHAQRAELEAEVVFHGWTVVEWIDDLGQPGTTLERPGLKRALDLLAAGKAHALIACEPTRLSRSAAVMRQLAAHAATHGWQPVIVQDDRQLLLLPAEPRARNRLR